MPEETLQATNEPLGHYEFEEPSEGARRDGTVLKVAGETFVGMAVLPAALIYQSFRDGTNFWFWFALALVVIGGVLGAWGAWIEKRGDAQHHERLESWILSAAGEP